MTMTLYSGAGSPYAWRVGLALEHKQLPYEIKMLSFSANDTLKPEFIALNPRHQVPVLTDGDFALYESAVILEYLEEKYPANPLLPKDIQQRAIARRLAREADVYFGAGMDKLTHQYFSMKENERNKKMIEQGREEVLKEFVFFEKEMRGVFLAGENLSIADCTLYPMLALVNRIEFRYPEVALMQHAGAKLGAWKKRIEALPHYAKHYPQHWK